MTLPRGLRQTAELNRHVEELAPLLPGVVDLRYRIDDDWSGDPGIFFSITLSDEAASRAILGQTSRRIMNLITERIDPMAQWDLIPYFSFRSQSEQENRKEEVFG